MSDLPDGRSTLRDRVDLALKSIGTIAHIDSPSTETEAPAVVVERLDVVQRWTEAVVRAEVANVLDAFATDVGNRKTFTRETLVATLRKHVSELRGTEVA